MTHSKEMRLWKDVLSLNKSGRKLQPRGFSEILAFREMGKITK